jgi:hypothetical protein
VFKNRVMRGTSGYIRKHIRHITMQSEIVVYFAEHSPYRKTFKVVALNETYILRNVVEIICSYITPVLQTPKFALSYAWSRRCSEPKFISTGNFNVHTQCLIYSKSIQ